MGNCVTWIRGFVNSNKFPTMKGEFFKLCSRVKSKRNGNGNGEDSGSLHLELQNLHDVDPSVPCPL